MFAFIRFGVFLHISGSFQFLLRVDVTLKVYQSNIIKFPFSFRLRKSRTFQRIFFLAEYHDDTYSKHLLHSFIQGLFTGSALHNYKPFYRKIKWLCYIVPSVQILILIPQT